MVSLLQSKAAMPILGPCPRAVMMTHVALSKPIYVAHIECRRPEGEELLGDCVTREYPNHRRRINAHHRSITRGADEVLQSRVDFSSTLSAQRLSVAIQTLIDSEHRSINPHDEHDSEICMNS